MSDFIGTYKFAVDEKGRFSIPAAVREGLSQSAEKSFIVSPGPDGCLDAYPLDEWKRRKRVVRSLPHGRSARHYKRIVFGGGMRCMLDRHNRILVPPKLLRTVGIKGSVLIIGLLDHMEFWNPQEYERYLAFQKTTLEDVLEEIDRRMDKATGLRPEGET